MNWQVCECGNPACAFRFPAESENPQRHACPLCGTPTTCTDVSTAAKPPAMAPEPALPTLHLLLDNLRSSYNVGSLFRTAEGAGNCKLHLCGITPTPAHPKLQKTALGAEFIVPWEQHRNALHAADALRQSGVALWALETDVHAVDLFEVLPAPTQPLALIIGSEMIGVDPALLAQADRVVRLPMRGQKGSLNVASAAAIAIYAIRFVGK